MSNNFNAPERGSRRSPQRFHGKNDATDMNADSFSFSDSLLEGSSDSTWDDMLDEFNSIDQANEYSGYSVPVSSASQTPQPQQNEYRPSSEDGMNDGFNDDLNDDFGSDFNDDFGGNVNDDFGSDFNDKFGGNLNDDFGSDFNDDFDSELNGDFDNNDSDQSVLFSYSPEKTEKKNKASGTVGRIVVVLIALAFGIGVLFAVKLNNTAADITDSDGSYNNAYVTHSDSPDTVSSAPAEESSETSSDVSSDVSSEDVPPENSYKELKYGEKSNDILKMQKRLCELGYISESSCTGYFGKYTRSKIQAFQKAAGLNETGKADNATLAKLYSEDAPKAK